ncbi:MAG: type II secretion system major pseudopilin GspG [Deltaproteobacteria bacterium]|nr:type II secretion system major pseudopilin GspG [Deltaproteobacteria bacterium]
MLRSEKGFSLMEILVALFIIGLFAGGAAVGVKKISDGAKKKRAIQDIRVLAAAIDQFEMDNGIYPKGIEELVNDPGDLPDYQPGGYLNKREVPKDPWKHEYLYVREGAPDDAPYDLLSYGADGSEGGDGKEKDIRLSELD